MQQQISEQSPNLKRLPLMVRSVLIADLVKAEGLEGDDAVQAAKDWNEQSDLELIKANNYVRSKQGLPERRFQFARQQRAQIDRKGAEM